MHPKKLEILRQDPLFFKLEFSLNAQPDNQIMNRLYWRSLEVHALTLAENDSIFSQ